MSPVLGSERAIVRHHRPRHLRRRRAGVSIIITIIITIISTTTGTTGTRRSRRPVSITTTLRTPVDRATARYRTVAPPSSRARLTDCSTRPIVISSAPVSVSRHRLEDFRRLLLRRLPRTEALPLTSLIPAARWSPDLRTEVALSRTLRT